MICLVTGPDGVKRLIRAKSNKAAIDFVVSDSYSSKSVSADDLVDYLESGLKVEDAISDDVPVQAEDDTAEGAPVSGQDDGWVSGAGQSSGGDDVAAA